MGRYHYTCVALGFRFLGWLLFILRRSGAFSSSSLFALDSSSLCLVNNIGPIRLLTWNILAQCYLKRPPHFLVGEWSNENAVWPMYTDWPYREEKITLFLSEHQPDVVCFQEVELAMLNGGLEQRWVAIGYDCFIQDTSHGHPVTNVILISRSLQWNVIWKESRSRALILGIQPNNVINSLPFFLVNVHLQASSRDRLKTAQTRYSQVQSLLKRIQLGWNRMGEQQRVTPGTPPPPPCRWHKEQRPELIIMGDFNFSPSDPLYMLLVHGQWPTTTTTTRAMDEEDPTTHHPNCKYQNHLPPGVSEQSASLLPLLPLRDVRLQTIPTPTPSSQNNKNTKIMSRDPPLEALLPSSSSPSSWTYAPGQCLYDYIFVSDHVDITERQHIYLPPVLLASSVLSYSDALQGRTSARATSTTADINTPSGRGGDGGDVENAKRPIPRRQQGQQLYWPNKYHPSDHLPLGVTVQIQLPMASH